MPITEPASVQSSSSFFNIATNKSASLLSWFLSRKQETFNYPM